MMTLEHLPENAQTPSAEGSSTYTTTEVQNHYARVALDVLEQLDDQAICGCESCDDTPSRTSEAKELYTREIMDNLPEGALAASRGCGDPVAKAQLAPGEVVVDLGSGGGIDALIAARFVGEAGYVYGIDMTYEMIELAERNAVDAKVANVEFVQGTIEEIPLPDASVDVVLSNCVINFSDDKPRVMREACRILKPGGRFVVSDIVSYAPIAKDAFEPLCRIVGCTKGMQSAESYRTALEDAGFVDIVLEPKTTYTLDILEQKARAKNRMRFFESIADEPAIEGASGSVIIYAYKPQN
ncbi:MAG: methyltransferase domain-containing protein [Eggerthellaceae bacterium]|nr:methyltransferase domain-containing protein [Eggerthellaceae bacterium]